MKHITRLDDIDHPLDKAVVTIGNFDGVHLGHQALFKEVRRKAAEIGGTSVAITFDPHPITVLKPEGRPPLITLTPQKAELIADTGIDVLLCIPFNREFAAISPQDFLEGILIDKLGMKAFIVGGDYAFGRNRQGNLAYLREAAIRLGFEMIVADWVQTPIDGERISSTRIRELVMAGDVVTARKLLGRYYQIRGEVEHGRNRGGRLLACPTANIRLQDELAPKIGVYAVTVECDGACYKGVANIGFSPTFDDHVYTVEVHIFDFEQRIYGRPIRVNFVRRIRDERKFAGLEELSAQIQRDIRVAREILAPGMPA